VPQPKEPLFNVPTVVLVVITVLIVVHVGRLMLPEDLDTWLVVAGAFVPSRYAGDADVLPGGSLALLTSPLTYQLLHGDITHLAFNSLWLLAFGSAVAFRSEQFVSSYSA
jgi:membrane associated rhomboid family serine protease